ncbi:sensor histidine kinase [Intestinibacter sp.]
MRFLNRDSYLVDFAGIYFILICVFFTVLRDVNIYHMYLILNIINGLVGIFAYIMSVITLSTAEEKIYKDLAKIFGIVAIINVLFTIYVFDNRRYETISQEVEIMLGSFFTQILLYITFVHVYGSKKDRSIFEKITYLIIVCIPIFYILITWMNLIPNIYENDNYSIVKNILCIIFIMGYIYCLTTIDKLNKQFYNYRTVKDIKLLFICIIGKILLLLVLGGIDFFDVVNKTPWISKLNCISLIILNFLNVYLIYAICFRDIIKRPNRNLYYNLLDEKQKLQENIKTLEEVSFNLEYYKTIYEQLLKNMPCGIVISSKDKIIFVNNKILNLFNLQCDESIMYKNILDLIDNSEKEEYVDKLNNLKKYNNDQNMIATKFSYNNVTFEGEEIRFSEKIHEINFQVSIIDSIEDKIKLENAQRELQLRDAMEKARDEVLSNISHEFKTPVNVIYSTVQIQDLNLQKENYSKILEFNKLIKQNCNRLIRLINNFIDCTKLDNNKLELHLKCVNIVYIVEDIATSVINFAERQNIQIIFDTEEEELYCDIDIEHMERIMLNILSNAIKYNKRNGTINVIVKNIGEEIYIEVIDTGIGIPKDKIDLIFDRFERMDNKNAVIKQGSGIGLSIVKKLVDVLDGRIEIESEVNEGTTVRLIFKKSKNQNAIEEIYDISQHLEEKVNLEMSDIS